MSLSDKIEAIQKVRKNAQKALDRVEKQSPELVESQKEEFRALMRHKEDLHVPQHATQQAQRLQKGVNDPSKRPTLIEAVNDQHRQESRGVSKTPDTKRLLADIERTIEGIQQARSNVQAAGNRAPAGSSFLLRNRLSEVTTQIKSALTQAGAEYAEPSSRAAWVNPLQRFLGLLTHGQSQLQQLGTHIEKLESEEKELSPARMLSLQIKVNKIQQHIELFTNMLNKGLESIKTLMNVQV